MSEVKVKNPPEEIYLCVGDLDEEVEFVELNDVTWAQDITDNDDIAYVRKTNQYIGQELLYKTLGEIVNRIEACGASAELTHAVVLASDLSQAVGNQYNPANPHALERVIEAMK